MSNVIPLPIPTHSLLMHDGDYVLDPQAKACWITVDNISVHIIRHNGEVAVSLYPLYDEMNDPIDTATALLTKGLV